MIDAWKTEFNQNLQTQCMIRILEFRSISLRQQFLMKRGVVGLELGESWSATHTRTQFDSPDVP